MHFSREREVEMKIKKDYLIVTSAAATAMLAFFGAYALPTFQTDTYAKWFYSLNSYMEQCFSTARYAEALYVWLSFHSIGNPVQHGFTHVALACFINCAVTVYIWHILSRRLRLSERKDNWLMKALLVVSVVSLRANVFNSDIFQYGYDAAVTFLGDACAILSAVVVSKGGGYRKCFLSCVLAIAAVTFRQTSLLWFVLVSMILFYIDYLEINSYSCIRELVKRVGVYMAAGVFPVVCIRTFVSAPVRGSLDQVDLNATWKSLNEVIKALFLNCLGIMPKYFYTMLLMVASGLYLFFVLTGKWDKSKWRLLLVALVTLLGIFSATFVTAIFDTWLPHRVLVGFTTLLPVIVILSVVLLIVGGENRDRSRQLIIILALLLLFLFISWYFTMKIFQGQVITNAVDQRDAHFYYEQIRKYEKLSGHEVKNVAYKRDENYTSVLPGVIASKSINERAFSTPWAQREIIRLLEGKALTVVPFSEQVYTTYFYGKDWETLSEEQVKCIGDTAYIMLY